MSDKSKLITAFVLGAIAGVGIVKLLETEKGQELVDKAKEKARHKADELKEKIDQLQTELAELLLIDKDEENSTSV